MLSRPLLPVFIVLCLLFSAPLQASSEAAARAQFKAGIAAFQNNDLEQARQLLEAAATQLQSRALIYNLGVLYYRLGEFDDAERMFGQLLSTKQRALASYNIGLIALARNQTSRAREAFLSVASESTEDNLIKLARGQLEELGAPSPPSRWQTLLSLSAGYQENIALFPDSAPSSLDGSFLESVNAISGYPLRKGKNALKTRVLLYGRQYREETDFNSHLVRAEAAWEHSENRYRFKLGLGGDQLWQGGASRERRARLTSDVSTGHCSVRSETARCNITLSAEQIFAADRFSAYDGQHFRLDSRYKARFENLRGEARYRVDYDDRQNLNNGSEYYSVSPLGQTLTLGLGYAFTPGLELGASASYRFNYYRTPHRLEVPEGLLIVRREDNRLTLELEGKYRINKTVSLLLTLRQAQNNSNIERYDYNQKTATLGVAFRL